MSGSDMAGENDQVINPVVNTSSTPDTTPSTGTTTSTSVAPATSPVLTSLQQSAADNAAILGYTHSQISNPGLPNGTEVTFNDQKVNDNELLKDVTLDPNIGKGNVTQAVAGQADDISPKQVATYDATLVDPDAVIMEAATAAIDASHLVSGRLTELLQPGSDGTFPTWASGAARRAQQMLAARGIDNSSMAGQAIMAAIIDAAMPIAQGDSQALVAMDMQNLTNKQQTNLFNAQTKANFLLSNQAADNAAKNFNAGSINQANEFYANLASQVSTFNAAQRTAVSAQNAQESNAMEKFDKTMQDAREKFNAQNSLIVQQANTQWRRQVNTTNTAAQNEANRINALNKLGISNQAYANTWQAYRDEASWLYTSAENVLDRNNKLGQIALYQQGRMEMFDATQQAKFQEAFGGFLAGMFSGALDAL